MRAGGGKSKGNAFEREVCKRLSLWITAGRRDDVLWRSAISGGRATVGAKKGKQMAHVAGDICAVHPEGELFVSLYFVEVKNYRDIGLTQLVTKSSGKLLNFWHTACEQAKQHGKEPMLIFKQAQCPAMLGVRRSCRTRFGIRWRAEFPFEDLVLFDFDDFLQLALPPRARPRV